MKRIFSAAAVLSMFAAVGCSNAMIQPQAAGNAESNAAATAEAKEATAEAKEATAAAASESEDAGLDATATAATLSEAAPAAPAATMAPWTTGDFVVYRFSGSFRKTPVTLTEKVIARMGDTFVLDVTYQDGATKETIRAHMKGDAPIHGDVVSVARLVHGVEQAAPIALYEELFARVALVADQNEAQLGSESVKVDVAGRGAVACEKATYRVKVGAQTATMQTLGSNAFVWGDVGSQITAANGKLLYKAEVVDTGHESTKSPAIASADDDY